MKISAVIFCAVFLLPAVLVQPASVFSADINFNMDGMAIDKVQYEILVAERDNTIRMQLENG